MGSKIALVQHPPVLGNRSETIEKAASLIEEAARAEARLVVLPEAFVPGYPTYIWRLKPGGDMALSSEIHALMLDNAVSLDGTHLKPLQNIAKHAGKQLVHPPLGRDCQDVFQTKALAK